MNVYIITKHLLATVKHAGAPRVGDNGRDEDGFFVKDLGPLYLAMQGAVWHVGVSPRWAIHLMREPLPHEGTPMNRALWESIQSLPNYLALSITGRLGLIIDSEVRSVFIYTDDRSCNEGEDVVVF